MRVGTLVQTKPIHECFIVINFCVLQYLFEHGAKKFFSWFDYMVWYPLGRPVG